MGNFLSFFGRGQKHETATQEIDRGVTSISSAWVTGPDGKTKVHRGSGIGREASIFPLTLRYSFYEVNEMRSEDSSLLNTKAVFIEELREKYKQWYSTVLPIPYIRDRMLKIDRVFVEGCIVFGFDSLASHHEVFTRGEVKSTRRVLIGQTGYGKSTLSLQFAYDWCNEVRESYLSNVEILILLRLRQLDGVTSIYKAIRQFILSSKCPIQEQDIQSILENSSSVVIILDGFDEYGDEDASPVTDVMKIITAHMFPTFDVILTGRSLPKPCPPETKSLRLTGFDDKARDEYIRKAVVNNDEHAIKEIKDELDANPVLSELCQSAMFFVLYAHMRFENESLQNVKTATGFFKRMIECLHSHMRNKMEDENTRKNYLYEERHEKLDEFAFEGLCKRKFRWKRKFLKYLLGEDFYDIYVRIGVLVEDISDHVDGKMNSTDEDQRTEVRFFHVVFQEWYAAHYLASSKIEEMTENMEKVLKKDKETFDREYFYRFTCGLSGDAALKVTEYLVGEENGKKVALLCIQEREGIGDKILPVIEKMCLNPIDFEESDNKASQRANVGLLKIASSHNIPVPTVTLRNCNVKADNAWGIQLNSNLKLPPLSTLKELWIYEKGKEVSETDMSAVLQYSSKCVSLEKLWLWECLLPRRINVSSGEVPREAQVLWRPHVDSPINRLNIEYGVWKRIEKFGGLEMTDEDYEMEREQVESLRRG